MKRNFFPLGLLLVIGLLFVIPLFKESFFKSHDGEAHVARFAAYYNAYSDGQFPARWAGNLNYGYGSPVFIFYYPLPGTLASFVHALGISYEQTFKLLIALSFILSFVTFYIWIKNYVKTEFAFLGALLYGLAPYHFLNLYIRGDIAELAALSFVPLVFYFIDKSFGNSNIINIILAAFVYALVIFSHNAISLMFSPVLLIYIFMCAKKKSNLLSGLIIILLGLCVSAFFWIPALYEGRFTNAKLFIGDMYLEHFPPIVSLFYSNWGFGPDVNKTGGLSPQIGPIIILLVIASVLLIISKKKINCFNMYWLAIFFGTIFLTVSQSSLFWQHLPLLKLFQFPWRLNALSSFAAIVFSIIIFNKFITNKKIVYGFIACIIIISISYTSISSTPAKNDRYYDTYRATTDYHGQASSIWTAGDFSKKAKKQVEVIAGEASISKVTKRSNIHTFAVNAKNQATLVDNTVYFPGWKVFVNGKQVNIEFQDPLYKGLITFKVPEGASQIRILFSESADRLIADIISTISAIILILLFTFRIGIDKMFKYYEKNLNNS